MWDLCADSTRDLRASTGSRIDVTELFGINAAEASGGIVESCMAQWELSLNVRTIDTKWPLIITTVSTHAGICKGVQFISLNIEIKLEDLSKTTRLVTIKLKWRELVSYLNPVKPTSQLLQQDIDTFERPTQPAIVNLRNRVEPPKICTSNFQENQGASWEEKRQWQRGIW